MKRLSKDGVGSLVLCEKQNAFMTVADKIQYIKDGTDLFYYDYNHFLEHQFAFENKASGIRTSSPESQFIIGLTDGVRSSFKGFSTYWDAVKKQKCEVMDSIGHLELGKNAYIIPENSALCLIPTLDIRNNVCACIYSRISNLGIINSSLMEFVMKEFYKAIGISPEKKVIEELSYFEKKLVSIYRFELLHPEFLIFENPFFGLDNIACEQATKLFSPPSEHEHKGYSFF